MRTVEGVNVTAAGQLRPPTGLDRATQFQGELIEAAFPGILPDPPLAPQSQQIAERADVVKAVIMHAHVADVRGHLLDRVATTNFQELCLVRGVELQNCRAILETLRPFGPASSRVFPCYCENRRTAGWIVVGLDREDLLAREL